MAVIVHQNQILGNSAVTSFNGRSGSIIPITGDYNDSQIILSSVLHIGGETQTDVQEALVALRDNGGGGGGSGVGKSLAGQTVHPSSAQTVTAGEGAEIFNDYRERTYTGTAPTAGNIASGEYSHAEGERTTAAGNYAHAEGQQTSAAGTWSHAEGYRTSAINFYCHAEGADTKANALACHAEGNGTQAGKFVSGNFVGLYSHAEGNGTQAYGQESHAEGLSTEATYPGAHAEGGYTKARGAHAHAEGFNTITDYAYQHVGGKYNDNKSYTLFEVGNGSGSSGASDERHNAFEVYANGDINVNGNIRINGSIMPMGDPGVWTTPVSCLTGDTSVTITDPAIKTTSYIDRVSAHTADGVAIGYTKIAITTGQAVITFSRALTQAASVTIHIINSNDDMSFIPMGVGGGTDVPDYEVFNDISDFIAPTIGQSGGVDLISRLSGGYKVVGNLVYVYMMMYLNKNAFSTSTDWYYPALVTGLPECATWAPVATGRWGINSVMGGTLGKYGAGQSAWITIGVIPNEVKTASDPRIVVQFIYERKH